MGISQSKFVKYDTPVYYQMKKHYGQKCMQDIEKLIKHHDFPKEGTLSLTKLKVVRDSVEQSSEKQPGCCCKCVKHVCKKCEQTVDCWLKEADKRERKQMQKELAGRKNEKCESLSVCVSAPPEPTNPQYASDSPHENAVRPAPPEYRKHIYPIAQLSALKFDPDLDCSPPRQPQQDAQARAARGAEREERETAQAAQTEAAGRATQAAQAAREARAAQTAQEEREARVDALAARVDALAAIVEQEVREIAQAVKASYIEWQSGRLTTTLAHAVHAEEQLLTKKDKAAKVKGEREMQLAVVQIKASTSAAPAKPNWTNRKKRGYQGKWKCGLCATNEHEFLAARSVGCARTMDTGHRTVQRRARRIETRGTENRRGEGG